MTIQAKIYGLKFTAVLKEITSSSFKWSIVIGAYETEYNVGNGHYFDVYGYHNTAANKNAVHYLIKDSHKLRKDNILSLYNRLVQEHTYKDLKLTDKIKVISNFELKVIAPVINDVLYSLYSDAMLSLDYSLDEFANEFMQGKKISETIECYKSCENALRFLIQSKFSMTELQEYFESIGY